VATSGTPDQLRQAQALRPLLLRGGLHRVPGPRGRERAWLFRGSDLNRSYAALSRPAVWPPRPRNRHPQSAVALRIPRPQPRAQDSDKTTHRSSRAGPTIRCTTVRAAEAYRSAADHERHFKEAPMSATSPARLSYDVFVSDGPAGAGDERMPAGAPLAWSRPALPGPCVAVDRRIDALEVVARWPCEARGPGRGGSAAGAGLDPASSLALAGREPGRLGNPGLPGHRPAKGRNRYGEQEPRPVRPKKILKHVRHVTVVADRSRR